MTWILSNWVERRASRERHLRNGVDVWRKTQAALHEACESLNEHYSDIAVVRSTKQNPDVVTIAITRRASSEVNTGRAPVQSVIAIKFDPDKCRITVTADNGMERKFPIEADCDHAFIFVEGREVLFDEFSQWALEEAFFSPLQSPLPHRTLRIAG
jgi:hypothetical protein